MYNIMLQTDPEVCFETCELAFYNYSTSVHSNIPEK